MVEMYYQREANVLGTDYFERQGWHPSKEKMTKEEYQDFVLRYKGCGACFPMYHTLNRFEKMWFTAIQKDVAELENKIADIKANCDLAIEGRDIKIKELEKENARLTTNEKSLLAERKIIVKENAELKARLNAINLLTPELEKLSKLKTQQLTKAKEHIRTLISCLIDWVQEGDKDYCYIAEAEQFINEIEK